MARKVKERYIGARVDEDQGARVDAYVEMSADIDSAGDLIRKALNDYMTNHPIPTAEPINQGV